MARGLSKTEKGSFVKLLLAEANIGKLDIFNDDELNDYYIENNLAAQDITVRQYSILCKEVRKQSRHGLDPEQLLATTVIRNIGILDKVDADLGLVGKHANLCESEIMEIQGTYSALESRMLSEGDPTDEAGWLQRKRDYETASRLFDQKQKTRNSLAGFMKMKSSLYKNVNEISKNQTDLNYKMAIALESKRKNDIMEAGLLQKNPVMPKSGIDEFKYSDCDIEEVEEAIKIQISGQKHLLSGLTDGD